MFFLPLFLLICFICFYLFLFVFICFYLFLFVFICFYLFLFVIYALYVFFIYFFYCSHPAEQFEYVGGNFFVTMVYTKIADVTTRKPVLMWFFVVEQQQPPQSLPHPLLASSELHQPVREPPQQTIHLSAPPSPSSTPLRCPQLSRISQLIEDMTCCSNLECILKLLILFFISLLKNPPFLHHSIISFLIFLCSVINIYLYLL